MGKKEEKIFVVADFIHASHALSVPPFMLMNHPSDKQRKNNIIRTHTYINKTIIIGMTFNSLHD